MGALGDVVARSPGFESGISLNDPEALQDHCVILYKLRVEEGRGRPPEAKEDTTKKLV